LQIIQQQASWTSYMLVLSAKCQSNQQI